MAGCRIPCYPSLELIEGRNPNRGTIAAEGRMENSARLGSIVLPQPSCGSCRDRLERYGYLAVLRRRKSLGVIAKMETGSRSKLTGRVYVDGELKKRKGSL